MKNFIEVNTVNKQIILNVNHIIKVKMVGSECYIVTTGLGVNGKNESFRVMESYDQIKLLISQALM